MKKSFQNVLDLPKTVSSMYTEKKEQSLAKLGSYALEKFGKSKYARRQLNTVPTSLLAGLVKSVFNFLVMYRLNTGVGYIDFFISLLVTIVLAAISPIFYFMVKDREADLMTFSNHVADQLQVRGFDFVKMWKGRTVALLGLIAIAFLLCFDVDSPYLIKTIIEMLLSFWIVDQINTFRDSIFLPVPIETKEEFIPRGEPIILTKYDIFEIPVRNIVRAKTLSNSIEVYKKPLRAVHISNMTEYKEKLIRQKLSNSVNLKRSTSAVHRKVSDFSINPNSKEEKMIVAGGKRLIMEDWVNLTSNSI